MRLNKTFAFGQWLTSLTLIAGLGACSSAKKNLDNDLVLEGSDASTQTVEENSAGTQEIDLVEKKQISSRIKGSGLSRTGGRSHRLEIKSRPFQANGFWMNSVYFVRGGESWDTLSQLFYGRPDRSELLSKWNAGAQLRAGEVIYYNSPSRPDDEESLKLFSDDFQIQSQQIVVAAGDTLSSLAQKHFGSFQAWHEIVATNPQLSNPDLISIGQELNILPSQFDTQPFLQKLIANSQKASQNEAAQNNQSDQANDLNKQSDSAMMGSIDDVDQNPPAAAPPIPSDSIQIKQSAGQKISALAQRIPDKVLIAATLLLILGLVGYSVRRRMLHKHPKKAPNPFSTPGASV